MFKAQIILNITLQKAPDEEQMQGITSAINFEAAKVVAAYEACYRGS